LNAPPLMRIPVGVLVERRVAASPWIDHVWNPVAVLAGEPETPPWTRVSEREGVVTFFAGIAAVELYVSETANYRDNLVSEAARLWVVLRATGVEPPYDLLTVTADPAEGEGYTAAGSDLVDAVPMPESVREAVEAFVVEHHVERAFYKRQRVEADPNARGQRARGERGEPE
jgi:hypothetical protein